MEVLRSELFLILNPGLAWFGAIRSFYQHLKTSKVGVTFVNSRAMFTTHSRVMFTSDDRLGVYHINDNHADLVFNTASFLQESWR